MPQPVDLYRWRDAILSEGGPANPLARLTLLAVAQHMKADGTGAWPSQKAIAKRTCAGERSVRRHLEIAERHGWITRERVRRANGRNWYYTEYSAVVPDSVYTLLPEKPWDADPDWRREPATVAATHVDDRPQVPPVNASTGQSVHEYRPTETRVPANGDIDDRPQWPTNSPSETLPRTLPKEGALSRTPVPQSLKAKSPRGARPEPLAKTSASTNSDPEVLREKNRDAISRLLSGGVTPYDITRMLAARGVTVADVDAVRFPDRTDPT